MTDDNFVDDILQGSGRCICCGLFKPLVMIALPGLYTDEDGEMAGECQFEPANRTGYCEPCAMEMLKRGEFDKRSN